MKKPEVEYFIQLVCRRNLFVVFNKKGEEIGRLYTLEEIEDFVMDKYFDGKAFSVHFLEDNME